MKLAIIKEAALTGLAYRRAHPPAAIDNASLHAGADMFFYCRSCGWLADIKPENYLFPVRPLCSECAGLEAEGWLGPDYEIRDTVRSGD